MERNLLVVLLPFLIASVVCQVRVDPLVLISGQGLVRGHRSSNGQHSIFLGIPYAKVDVNDPFGHAQVPQMFEEVIYDANDGSVKCPQMTNQHVSSDNEAIDCLSLNIFVPTDASFLNPLPVLIWFHGGEFARGSGGEYDVSNLVRHDVIVVTINYRLGPYGFMCLNLPEVPGNQGLKDQYVALQWIRKHVGSFGGNPYNMTIAGQNAGATSVLLHLYSDKDRYFGKAIVESGTPQSEGMFVNPDESTAIKLAGHLGLNTTDTHQALRFLTATSHELVTAAAYELNLQLKPCKERSFSGVESFVQHDPYSLTNPRKVQTSILIGYTSNEQYSLSSNYFNSDPFYEKIQNNFNIADLDLRNAVKIVRQFYIGDKAVTEDVATELKMFESDFGHYHPTERHVKKLLEENINVIYKYMFSYNVNSDKDGGHVSELNYLFNSESGSYNNEDQLMVDRITTMWTDFVKHGNPTPSESDLIPVSWTPITEDIRPTMIIDSNLRMEGRVYQERIAFWDLFYSIYGNSVKLIRKCSDNPYMCC